MIKAIETRYAGCRFRSRLEARWAVFFDTLGIPWTYEPEGYLVGPDSTPYLPDFWLPGEGLWVEVKGNENQIDAELLAAASLPGHGLPVPSEPRREDGYDVRLLILGEIGRGILQLTSNATGEPAGYCQPAHTVLTALGSHLFQGSGWFEGEHLEVTPNMGLVADSSGIRWTEHKTAWGNWVGGGAYLTNSYDQLAADAYQAARSARFEHGESGRRP